MEKGIRSNSEPKKQIRSNSEPKNIFPNTLASAAALTAAANSKKQRVSFGEAMESSTSGNQESFKIDLDDEEEIGKISASRETASKDDREKIDVSNSSPMTSTKEAETNYAAIQQIGNSKPSEKKRNQRPHASQNKPFRSMLKTMALLMSKLFGQWELLIRRS